jgi:raffinose/stachyose/melibiose transport system substrate-binding protein
MTARRTVRTVLAALAIGTIAIAHAQAPTVLTFWFEGESPSTVQLFQQAADRFAAQYHLPVRVEITAFAFEDMLRTMPLALDGGTGPDIAAVPPLTQGSDRYAQAGHLVDLTEIAAERGWLDTYSADVLAYNNAGTPGRIFGIPYALTTVGVYYNSELFDELGLAVPSTFDEFEALLAALKDAGYTPVSVGARDGWPLDHVWSQILHTNVPIDIIAGLESLDPDKTYEDERFYEASYKVLEWAQAGYLDPDMLSVSYADANAMFISGQVPMTITGTWAQADFTDQPDFVARFFPMPQYNTSLPWHAGGSAPYNNLVIPNGPNVEFALDFYDYLVSEENMTAFWNDGILVSFQFDEVPAPTTVLQGDIYGAMQRTGPGYYHGVISPLVNRELWAAHQAIVGGVLTPEQAMALVQEVYAAEAAAAGQ